MKLDDLLREYPDDALDRLAADKIDEVAGLRLPRLVLVQEIIAALSSLSYVARALAPARPPTYAILETLLDAPDHRVTAEGFREAVLRRTDELSEQARDEDALPGGKNRALYLRVVQAAWENDGQIDRSEALLLEALRKELGIWAREHHVLEHHPQLRPLWDSPRAFDTARNHLLTTGLIGTNGSDYVLPDEVCRQVRRVWDMDLEDGAYARMLERLSVAQLRKALERTGLPLSGAKEERVARLIHGLVPPAAVLDALHIDEVKDVCRSCGLPVSLSKSDLVGGLIAHFDAGADVEPTSAEPVPEAEPVAEERALSSEQFRVLLAALTVDQLQDLLSARGLRRGGSKVERVERLVASPWSERTLLAALPRLDLVSLCRRFDLRTSGVKDDLMGRLIEKAKETAVVLADAPAPARAIEADPEDEDTSDVDTEDAPLPPSRPPPSGLRDARADFPGLDANEQVVVAILRQARSLTEPEIERTVRQHGLGWFLIKAHMAELTARLANSGAGSIRVRSGGGVNIYEWLEGEPGGGGIERHGARDVIDALRQGVVPDRRVDLLAVGQEAARRHLVDLLEHVSTGRSEFKFVRGPYGAGKTFLCAWLKERALDSGFATSTVRIGPDQPLSDLPVFYAGMVRGLRTPENRDACALSDLLESWLLEVHRRAGQLEGVDPFAVSSREVLAPVVQARIEEDLGRLGGMDPSLASALRHYYAARIRGDAETCAAALAWLQGSRTLSADALRKVGVRGHLEAEDVFPRLRALLQLIRGGRLSGLLLLVDELELVRRFPHARQREQAYETLRLLIDEAGENGFGGCLVLCTGTDALFEDRRYGLGSYEALFNRVAVPQGVGGMVSMRQPVIQLEALDAELLRGVARRVREVHAVAYGWPASERVSDEVLDGLIRRATTFGDGTVERLPRPFLRELVHLLDLCEENPGVATADLLPAADTAGLAASVADLLGT
ncbi:MAG: BREX system ATP-binding domain-containing protein [Myxococcota bacterium]